MRVLALDYGSARCGCALSDPTGTLATPIEPIARPATRKGFARVVDLVRDRGAERVVVGLPLGLSGADTDQTREARAAAKAGAAAEGPDAGDLAGRAAQVDGAVVLAEVVEAPDAKALMDIADRVKGQLGDSAAIVLGTAVDGRVHLVAAVTPALVQRGVKAGDVVKVAAEVAGGGGGGRDTMAQAGGRDPDKLPEAIEAARAAIVHALG